MPYSGTQATQQVWFIACKIRPRCSFVHVIPIDASPIVFQDDKQHQEGPHLDKGDIQGPQALLVDEEIHEEIDVEELNLIEQAVSNQDELDKESNESNDHGDVIDI